MDRRPQRRAFLLGCNSGFLQHCESDAQTMCRALGHCGGWAAQCCTSGDLNAGCSQGQDGQSSLAVPVDIVTRRLRDFLKACAPGDTAVFYFSGHSRYNGEVFNLVVGPNLNDIDHLWNIETVVGLFKQAGTAAERLLILDCCDAGQAASLDGFWNTAAGTWGRIWVATRANEHAQELDGETNGGLFTAFIHRALTTEARRLAEQGCLTVNRADEFVGRWAREYASTHPKPSPQPGLYGNARHNIALADGLTPLESTGFDPAPLRQLADLIRAGGLAEETLSKLYEDVRRQSGLSPIAHDQGAAGTDAPLGLAAAIGHFATAWYRRHQPVKVPLAEFVERVARRSDNPRDLRAWLDGALQGLAGTADTAAFIASLALGQTETGMDRAPPKTHLAILLWARDANRCTEYSVEVRLVDAKGQGAGIETPADLMALGGMSNLLRQVLKDSAVLDAIRTLDRPLTIEFFLPKDLLGIDPDEWTPCYGAAGMDPREDPLSERYMVTVRAEARLPLGAGAADDDGVERYVANWDSHWANCASCHAADGRANGACCAWLGKPCRSYRSLLLDGTCVFLLGFTPGGDDLDLMLRNGLAAIVWGSEPLARGFRSTLLKEVARTYPGAPKRPNLADLPYAVLLLRQRRWAQSGAPDTGGLHLLWDDPTHVPAFVGRRAAAGAERGRATHTLRLRSPI